MKKYLITGATSSLGKALAEHIVNTSKEDFKLYLVSRSKNALLENLTSKNVKYTSGVDLLSMEENIELIDDIKSFFKGSFSIIHSAGDFWLHLPFLEVSTKTGVDMMNSHYGTFYNVLQIFLPHLIQNGGGRILTFSCNATEYHFPNMLPFTAAKAAIDATVKCIAHEHSKDGIVINSIALSSLKSEQNKDSKPYGDYDNYLDLKELSNTILDVLNQKESLMNGNIIKCFNYSESYYNEGYFQRIKQL